MDSCPPYRPFRGAQPPHFVDRPDEDSFSSTGVAATAVNAYRRGPADPRFHRLVVAGPAMGKTALLRAIARQVATGLDWVVVPHRCRPKERALGTVTSEVLAGLQRQWPAEGAAMAAEVLGRRLAGDWLGYPDEFRAGQSLAPTPPSLGPGTERSWSALRQLLQLAGRYAQKRSCGLLLIFDDVDLLGAGEAECLGYLARALSSDGLPVALLLSGGQALGECFARVGNFSGAVWPTRLDWFDQPEAREALLVPATDRGVDFRPDALELACRAAGGSPLELQRLGFAAWSAAYGGELVTVTDVEEALGLVGPGAVARVN
jgi:hypothetical protein